MSSDSLCRPVVDGEAYEIAFDALGLTRAHVEWSMGYEMGEAPDPVPGLIDELLAEAPDQIRARAGGRIIAPDRVRVRPDCLVLDGLTFRTGERIARLLKDAESMAVFVATVGVSTDRWIQRFFESEDTMRGFVADSIGSEAVEGAADWLEERIIDRAVERGLYTTSRFSPGFCDWSVSDQHKLFSLLSPGFCGITLTESALMVPIKSVSGIIGIGAECERVTTACMVCTLETCFRRR